MTQNGQNENEKWHDLLGIIRTINCPIHPIQFIRFARFIRFRFRSECVIESVVGFPGRASRMGWRDFYRGGLARSFAGFQLRKNQGEFEKNYNMDDDEGDICGFRFL